MPPPRRRKYAEIRSRGEYLTAPEVETIRRAAAKSGRHGHRDATMILLAFRHALRVGELVALKWDQVDLDSRTLYVRRLKGSKSGMHTMERDEAIALKKLSPSQRERTGPVFRTERGGEFTTSAFTKVVARAGREAGLSFPIHPHMLRHACGFALTRAGKQTRVIQDWMGHRNIQHTVRYTELDPGHFRAANLWDT